MKKNSIVKSFLLLGIGLSLSFAPSVTRIVSKDSMACLPNASNISVYASSSTTSISLPVHVVAGYAGMDRCDILEVQWSVIGLSYVLTNGSVVCDPDNGSSKHIIFQSTGNGFIRARVRNSCGWSDWSYPVPITVT